MKQILKRPAYVLTRSIPPSTHDQALEFLNGMVNPEPLVLASETLLEKIKSAMTLPHHAVSYIPVKLRGLFGLILVELLRESNRDLTDLKAATKLQLFPITCLSMPLHHGDDMTPFKRINSCLLSIRQESDNIFKILDELILEAKYLTPSSQSGGSEAAKNRVAVNAAKAGNLGKAISILSSNGMAPFNDKTLNAMIDLHPVGPPVTMPHFDRKTDFAFDEEEVSSVISSFKPDSAGGSLGLRAVHIQEALCEENKLGKTALLSELTKHVNFMANGKFDANLAPYLVGAQLYALVKDPDTMSIRPIASCETMSRIVERLIVGKLKSKMMAIMGPENQLCVGERGACEAIIHATNHAIEMLRNDENVDGNSYVLTNVDFRAAYQHADRMTFLKMVAEELPELGPYAQWSYNQPPLLSFGGHLIKSTSGTKQGSGLGPFLFGLTLIALKREMRSKLGTKMINFNADYADDESFIATHEITREILKTYQEEGPKFGLYMNPTKTTLFWPEPNEKELEKYDGRYKIIKDSGLKTLGGVVGDAKFARKFIDEKIDSLVTLLEKIDKIEDTQIRLNMHSASTIGPKATHLWRTTDPSMIPEQIKRVDGITFNIIEGLVGQPITQNQHEQATLPKRCAGMGFINVGKTAPISFANSLSMTADIQKRLLKDINPKKPVTIRKSTKALELILPLINDQNVTSLDTAITTSQFHLVNNQRKVNESRLNQLKLTASAVDKARILSCADGGSPWIGAVAYGATKMENTSIRLGIGLLLGVNVYTKKTSCLKPCKVVLDKGGVHALTCNTGGERTGKHNTLRDEFCKILTESGISAQTEPKGILLGEEGNQRPADVYAPLFEDGRAYAFDLGVTHPQGQQVLLSASTIPLHAADTYALKKRTKYEEQCRDRGIIFEPLIVETFGAWTISANKIFKRVGGFMATKLNIPKSVAIHRIKQRLAVKLQSGNACQICARY